MEARNPMPWRRLDAAACIAYGAMVFVGFANHAGGVVQWAAAGAGAALVVVSMTGRWRAPVWSAGALVALFAVLAVLAPSDAVFVLPPIVLALYAVGSRRGFVISAGAAALACAVAGATALPDLRHPGGIAVVVPAFLAAWAIGAAVNLKRRGLRVEGELTARLHEAELRSAELELVDQRVRIARELHDVVAHGMSVITVQAGFAGLVADDAVEVRTALGVIERAGRQTLDEMRTLLEVLRDGSEGAPSLRPAPRIRDLESVVAGIRETGIEVDFTAVDPATELSALMELTAYRIVQEALTNVVKHSGASRVVVSVEPREGELVVVIQDDGAVRPAAATQPGHGITGMRERCHILGGTLEIGPAPGGGYRVAARLPLRTGSLVMP